MNRREFYKELMNEYAFDKDTILANAKKGKRAGRKPLPLYIGMTAAAAAVVVGVGTAVMTLGGSKGGVQYVGGSLAALTDQQRIDKARLDIIANENSGEVYDMMITFTDSLSAGEVQSLLTAYSEGNVPVKVLYFADGSRAVGGDEVEAAFESGRGDITGAIASFAGYMMKPIMSDERVAIVELVTADDFDTAIPMSADGYLLSAEAFEDIINSDDEYSDSEQLNSSDYMTSNDDDSTDSNYGDGETSSDTAQLPDGVKLPDGKAVEWSYITDDLCAEKAFFLTDDVFYVKTESSVRLYRFDGDSATLACSEDIDDATVCWISENGSRMLVLGKKNGICNKLFILDAENCTIEDASAESIVGSGAIVEAAYNEVDNVLALSVYNNDSYSVYTAWLNGYQAAGISQVYSGGRSVDLLGESGGNVYFSDVNADRTVIYRANGNSLSVVSEIDDSVSVTLNYAFTHSVLNGTNEFGTAIFDPASESLIPIDGSKAVSFGVSRHNFGFGDEYCVIEDGAVRTIDKTVNNIAEIDFRRSLSSKYAANVSNGAVRIIPSDYSGKANDAIIANPVENAPDELRYALNVGVGAINAIAADSVEECGIDTAEKLSETLEAAFTDAARASIISKCGISGLSYTSSLSAIDLSESVLVISSSDGSVAEGTLYEKAGMFDGHSGYYAYSVRFALEDGAWKLDCLPN